MLSAFLLRQWVVFTLACSMIDSEFTANGFVISKWHNAMTCSCFLSAAVLKHSLGEKRSFVSSLHFWITVIFEGSQGRHSKLEAQGWTARSSMQHHLPAGNSQLRKYNRHHEGYSLLADLLRGQCLASFLIQYSPTCSRMVLPTVALPYQFVIKTIPHRHAHWLI